MLRSDLTVAASGQQIEVVPTRRKSAEGIGAREGCRLVQAWHS